MKELNGIQIIDEREAPVSFWDWCKEYDLCIKLTDAGGGHSVRATLMHQQRKIDIVEPYGSEFFGNQLSAIADTDISAINELISRLSMDIIQFNWNDRFFFRKIKTMRAPKFKEVNLC